MGTGGRVFADQTGIKASEINCGAIGCQQRNVALAEMRRVTAFAELSVCLQVTQSGHQQRARQCGICDALRASDRHAVLSSHNTFLRSAPQSLPKTRAKFLSQPPGAALIPGSGPQPQLLRRAARALFSARLARPSEGGTSWPPCKGIAAASTG